MKIRAFFILILLLLTKTTFAGEWESSGAPPLPYTPKVVPGYKCKILLERRQGSAVQTAVQTHVFTQRDFSEGNGWVMTKATDSWTLNPRSQVLEWLDGQVLNLSFGHDATLGGDVVIANIAATFKVSDFIISTSASARAPMAAPFIETQTDSNYQPKVEGQSEGGGFYYSAKCTKI